MVWWVGQVLLGHEVESYEEDDSCVHVRIKRCEGTTSGSSSNVALACDYLLAADGANSRTRSVSERSPVIMLP